MSKLDPFCPGCHSASLRRQAADPVEPCLSGVPGVTDWLKNVLARGSATIVTKGHSYEVDRPEVISMADVTGYFRPTQQRMHRQFHVDSAFQVRRRLQAHQ